MVRSCGDSEESRAQAARFEAEVERKAKALLKTNRKLAKDVTRWVDASMAKHEEACLKREGRDGRGDDDVDEALPVPPPRPEAGAQRERGGGSGGGGGNYDDGGVEETKGGGKSDAGSGVKSWLGGWIR